MGMKGRLVGLNQVLPKSLSPLYQAASSKLPSFRLPALPAANPKNSIFLEEFGECLDDDDDGMILFQFFFYFSLSLDLLHAFRPYNIKVMPSQMVVAPWCN